MQELKPCPFCGGEAYEHLQYGTFEGYNIKNIYCSKCGARNSDKTIWNTRIDIRARIIGMIDKMVEESDILHDNRIGRIGGLLALKEKIQNNF